MPSELPRLAVRPHLSWLLSWKPNMVDNQQLASCNHDALPTGSTSATTTTSTTQVVRRRAQSPLQAVRHDDNETGYPAYKISLGPAGSPAHGTSGDPFHSAFIAAKHSEAPSIQDQTGQNVQTHFSSRCSHPIKSIHCAHVVKPPRGSPHQFHMGLQV